MLPVVPGGGFVAPPERGAFCAKLEPAAANKASPKALDINLMIRPISIAAICGMEVTEVGQAGLPSGMRVPSLAAAMLISLL